MGLLHVGRREWESGDQELALMSQSLPLGPIACQRGVGVCNTGLSSREIITRERQQILENQTEPD